jgi:hypothetical protein
VAPFKPFALISGSPTDSAKPSAAPSSRRRCTTAPLSARSKERNALQALEGQTQTLNSETLRYEERFDRLEFRLERIGKLLALIVAQR